MALTLPSLLGKTRTIQEWRKGKKWEIKGKGKGRGMKKRHDKKERERKTVIGCALKAKDIV